MIRTHRTAALGLALFWALGLTLPAAAQDSCTLGRVLGGPATVTRGDTMLDAAEGMVLDPADRLETGAAARMSVTCGDGLTIAIGPGTVLQLDEVLAGEDPARAGLLRGAAGFLFNRSDRRGFEVRTPSAVAAVRSTEWAVEVTDGATAVFVRTGEVAVSAGEALVLLTPGTGVGVSASGDIGAPDRWEPARIDRLGALLGPDWEDGRRP